MSVWNYVQCFEDPPPATFRVSLGEGGTPLIRSRSIGPKLGAGNLFLKLESTNPSGSYKDRFAASAVSFLVAEGARLCLGCSSGNTGAALASYCASVGMPCMLAIVDTAPDAKLTQMRVHGARLVRLKGFGTDAQATAEIAARLQNLAASLETEVQISAFCHSPRGMDGVKTISFELSASGRPFRHVFCPAGAGGLALAVARGFMDAVDAPAVHCVQPEGNDTIASRLRGGFETAAPCVCSTKISGLQVANVMDGHETLAACRSSGGSGFTVSDADVFEVQSRLALEEGVFAEPAGAVALAGALAAVRSGRIDPAEHIVCLVTGSGFKDGASAERMMSASPPTECVASFDEFESIVRREVEAS